MRHRLVKTLAFAALAGATPLTATTAVRAQETAPATASAPTAAPGVTINGSIETYYGYNFNRPSSNNSFYLFDNREGQFGLNLVDLRIGKAATPTSRTGFLIRLIDGDAQRATI